MSWIDLLQDGAIVALSVSQIVQTVGLRTLARRLDSCDRRIEKLTDGSPEQVCLMHSETAGQIEYGRSLFGCHHSDVFGNSIQDPVSVRTAHGFNPYLFNAGDSVRVGWLDEDLTLSGYSCGVFTAKSNTSDSRTSATAKLKPDDVVAWKRNTGEWPVEWFTGDPDYANGSSNATVDAESIAGTDATAARKEPRESDPQTVAAAGIHIVANGSVCSPSEGQCLGSYLHRGSK